MAFKYKERVMYHGNQRLVIKPWGAASTNGKRTLGTAVFGTGLVSVSAMSDDAKITNFPADDTPDHATISGASLLKGTMKFMQLDNDVRTNFFGQETIDGGYGSTGVYPKAAVQYASLGSTQDGKPALLVTVYPNMSVTSAPTKETTTDSADTPTAIQWTAAVQASGCAEVTTPKGRKVAELEFFFTGDDVQTALDKIDSGYIYGVDATGTSPRVGG